MVDPDRGGVGHRHPDPGGAGAVRPEAQEERVQRRLDASARSRREDHEDERRPDAFGAHRRARRRSGDRGHRRRDGAGRGTTATPRRWSRRSSPPPNRSKRSCRPGLASPRSSETRGITATRRWSRVQPSASAAMSRSPIADAAHGRARRRLAPPCTANRRRIRGTRGQRLLRQRGELLERPNAHLYETGRLRRVHLRHHPNILKRVLVQVCGFNLGLLMRQLTGVGTPRSLQGRAAAACNALMASLSHLWTLVSSSWARDALDQPDSSPVDLVTEWHEHMPIHLRIRASTTGC